MLGGGALVQLKGGASTLATVTNTRSILPFRLVSRFELLTRSVVLLLDRLIADKALAGVGLCSSLVHSWSAQMLSRLMVGCLAALALAACAGRIDRSNPLAYAAQPVPFAPAQSSYVWARNDGQRMSGNPALLRQGQKDQAQCRDQANSGDASKSNVFAQCMQRRGYFQRQAG